MDADSAGEKLIDTVRIPNHEDGSAWCPPPSQLQFGDIDGNGSQDLICRNEYGDYKAMLINDQEKQEQSTLAGLTNVKKISNKIMSSSCISLDQENIEFQATRMMANNHHEISYAKNPEVCASRTAANVITKEFSLTTSSMSRFADAVEFGFDSEIITTFGASTDGDVPIPPTTVRDEIPASLS